MASSVSTAPYAGGLSRTQVVAWRNALFVVFAMCGIAMASWAARLPTVRDALAASSAQMGWLIFAISAGSILGLLGSSHIVARLGARRTIVLAFLLGPAGYALAGMGVGLTSYPVIFAGLVVFGSCFAVCDVAMNLQGAANERVLRRTIMPVYHAFFSGGTVLGAGAGALLERLGVPVLVHICGTAVLLVVGVQLSVRFLRSEHLVDGDTETETDAADHGTWRDRLAIWREPATLLIGLIVLGMAFAEGSANDWLALSSVDGHGTSNEGGAVVFGVFVAAMTIGRLAGVLVIDRFGRVPVLRASAALAVVGLAAYILVPNIVVAGIGVVLWGLGASLGFPVGMSAAADDPRRAAARVSAVATIGYCAFLIGPPVIGFLGEHVGLLYALVPVLVLVAVSGLVSGAARERAAARRQR
ncbi:MFS transporter [Galbitalea sp. SE-J8]|uniref:MFS transporter n=1 Tax=Galbitalea sp. SE-J8 TaxID=3054952 RepID=UPI00259CE84D|nr:MFS transporter [Galbitalea sp. SE-J8]MDM4763305.1 MFS transporter [Galbitalea sp. SE-J8]